MENKLVGAGASDFALTDTRPRDVLLSDLLRRYVVLEFNRPVGRGPALLQRHGN